MHAGETEDPLASGQHRIGHCGALVIQRLDLTFYSYKYFQQEDRATAARYVDVVIIIH